MEEKRVRIEGSVCGYIQMLQYEVEGLAVLIRVLTSKEHYPTIDKHRYMDLLAEYNSANAKFNIALMELGKMYGVDKDFSIEYTTSELVYNA